MIKVKDAKATYMSDGSSMEAAITNKVEKIIGTLIDGTDDVIENYEEVEDTKSKKVKFV